MDMPTAEPCAPDRVSRGQDRDQDQFAVVHAMRMRLKLYF